MNQILTPASPSHNPAPAFYPAAPDSRPAKLPSGWSHPAAIKARRAAREAAATLDALVGALPSVSVRIICADIAGNRNAGDLLERVLYWHRAIREGERRGDSRLQSLHEGRLWLARTYAEWWDECRLSEAEAKAAVARLVALGVIETGVWKFAANPTVHISLKPQVLVRLWKEAAENPNELGTYRSRSGSKKAESKAATSREPKRQKAGIETGKKAESLTGVTSLDTQEQQHAAPVPGVVGECHSEHSQPQACEQLNPDLLAQVLVVGVKPAVARALLAGHPHALIQAQLDYLPERRAANPPALLIKAIRENWDAPVKYLQQQQAQAAALSAAQARAAQEQDRASEVQQRAAKAAAAGATQTENAALDAAWQAMPPSEQAPIKAQLAAHFAAMPAWVRRSGALDAARRRLQRGEALDAPAPQVREVAGWQRAL